MTASIRLVALGGLGEVGLNCLCMESGEDSILIDCGVMFSGREIGVDIIHPDFTYLMQRAAAMKALIITHGHEDHIGAVPYLLRHIDLPIYGPPFALALIRERLQGFDFPEKPVIREIYPGDRLKIGPFEVEPIRNTHSIPDSTSLAIRTPIGVIVHTGDFKIDPHPLDDQKFNAKRLEEIGNEGVRLLLSDSTNIDEEGSSGSEKQVVAELDRQIGQIKGRAVVALFGSNIHRLRAVFAAAHNHNREVLLLGRSIQTHYRLASQLGLLPGPLPGFVNKEQAQKLNRERLLIAATGTQGEHRAALHRLAYSDHNLVPLEKGDEVILSSRIIPGNEAAVWNIINSLERRGILVWKQHFDSQLHVSGHAYREEQRTMLKLVRPKSFIPVHGDFHHMNHHLQLAQQMGVQDAMVIENGTVVEIDETEMRVVEHVRSGRVHLQANRQIDPMVLRDRKLMSELGIVVVTLYLNEQGKPVVEPVVFTRGVIFEDENQSLLVETRNEIQNKLDDLPTGTTDDEIRDIVCRSVRQLIRRDRGYRPLVHALITRSIG